MTGDVAGAAATLDELAAARRAIAEPDPSGAWIATLAFALLELRREAEILAEEDELGPPTPWWGAALAVAEGDLVRAADILQATGAMTFEAHAPRVLAAAS